jgi:hypothetical protein
MISPNGAAPPAPPAFGSVSLLPGASHPRARSAHWTGSALGPTRMQVAKPFTRRCIVQNVYATVWDYTRPCNAPVQGAYSAAAAKVPEPAGAKGKPWIKSIGL